MASANYFVSTDGNDLNPGTFDEPFKTIGRGVSALAAGDVLNLRGGSYVEPVDVRNKHGESGNEIVIRAWHDEHVTIDGCLDAFLEPSDDTWVKASTYDEHAHSDEWASAATFAPVSSTDRVNRGAFLNRDPYTRLITYGRFDDLRSNNQTFDKLPPDPNDGTPVLAGPDVTNEHGQPLGFRRPWVYMGPGLVFNRSTGRIHVRLSHTTNNVPGLADYQDATDPGQIPLAISHTVTTTLLVRNCSFLRFQNLSIRFGGEHTIDMRRTSDVTFDHVRVHASSTGVFLAEQNERTAFLHCELDGGLPSWYFRTDRKAEYHFVVNGEVIANPLGSQTSIALMSGGPNNAETTVRHCELVNGHDVYLAGRGVDLDRSWLHNLNDEAVLLDAILSSNVRIHHCVITQCRSGISMGGNRLSGPSFVYRNLVDLRSPTAAVRPTTTQDTDVFLYGHMYKSNDIDGPIDLFHNTVLVSSQDEQASYLHFRDTRGPYARRCFNNIFVSVNPGTRFDSPITFVPPPSFPGPTDGNCYFRIGDQEKPLLRSLAYTFQDHLFEARTYADLAALTASELFTQSTSQYEPGYESRSIETDPQFRCRTTDWRPQDMDDLRLRDNSPARSHGVALPEDLQALDAADDPDNGPDMGCYPTHGHPMAVGVDSRRVFPRSP